MIRAVPIAAALTSVIAAGVVHGLWTQRWTMSRAVEIAAAALGRVPTSFGDWRGRPLELDREQLEMAEIAGYIARRYENQSRNMAVTFILVCGRPGPISVHSPDVCYDGAGFEPLGPPKLLSLPIGNLGQTGRFRHAVFSKPNAALPTHLSILWSWSADGAWDAPDDPRLAFAPRRALYKLYVIREMASVGEQFEDEPSLGFLKSMMPELEKALFARQQITERSASLRDDSHRHGHHVGVNPLRLRRTS
jgi:hypothetical protein